MCISVFYNNYIVTSQILLRQVTGVCFVRSNKSVKYQLSNVVLDVQLVHKQIKYDTALKHEKMSIGD